MNNQDPLLGKAHSQRDALGKALVQLGAEYPSLVVLSPDVGLSTKAIDFQKKFPDRYICTGIAEMNTVGMAAGLSYMGLLPVVAGYAMFIAGKAWEPFRNTVAYPHRRVILVGTHAGINVGADGATHQAIEDIALMRSIPGMEIYIPADSNQVLPALRRAIQKEGPVYIRLERESIPDVFDEDANGKIKDISLVMDGEDIAILTIGGMLAQTIRAVRALKEKINIHPKVLSVGVIKPLNTDALMQQSGPVKGVVTVEDHNIHGGLGSCIAETLAQIKPVPIEMVALKDRFACSGNDTELKDHFGLGEKDIIHAVERAAKRSIS